MTTSKSDLEAKEGQVPNESNFLEFVSLLGSLSTRGGGASTQEEEGSEHKQEVGAAEEGESQQRGLFKMQSEPTLSTVWCHINNYYVNYSISVN